VHSLVSTCEEGKEVEDLQNYGSRPIEAVSTTRIDRKVCEHKGEL
jgi:hypothetical protein